MPTLKKAECLAQSDKYEWVVGVGCRKKKRSSSPKAQKPKAPKATSVEWHELIGEGTYGKVYRVVRNCETMACKVSQSVDWNEIDVLFRLSHPNVVHGIDFDKDNGAYRVFMKMAESDLAHYIKKHTLTVTQKHKLCTEVLNGMLYLHGNYYYHCDLKPSNILIIDGKAQIADFGLAYPIDTHLEFCGTPGITAPEGLKSKHHGKQKEFKQPLYHQQVDVFCVALVFIYILTGKYLIPLERDRLPQSYDDFIVNFPQNIKAMGLSFGWTDLLTNMLHPELDKRYSSLFQVSKHPMFSGNPIKFPLDKSVTVKRLDGKLLEQYKWLAKELIRLTYPSQIETIVQTLCMFYQYIGIAKTANSDLLVACFALSQQLHHDYSIKTDLKTPNEVWMIAKTLDGKLRTRSVSERAVSKSEALFSLFTLALGHYPIGSEVDEIHKRWIKRQGLTNKTRPLYPTQWRLDEFAEQNLIDYETNLASGFDEIDAFEQL